MARYSVVVLSGDKVVKRSFKRRSLKRAAKIAKHFNRINRKSQFVAMVGVPVDGQPISLAILRAKSKLRSA